MQNVIKAVAAALAAAAVIGLQSLLASFSGPAPAGVSTVVWGVVSAVGILVVNYLVGKFGPQA